MEKLKTKLKLLAVFIAVVMSTAFIVSNITAPTITYAEGNGWDLDDDGKLKPATGNYPSSAKTAWLCYITKIGSGGAPFMGKMAIIGKSSPSGQSILTTYNGTPFSGSIITNGAIPRVFTSGGAGQGSEMKQLMANGVVDGKKGWVWVASKLGGNEMLLEIQKDPSQYYLICEGIAWHKMFTGSMAGSAVVGTVRNFAAISQGPAGDGHTGWCDNFRLARGAMIQTVWPDLPIPPTELGSGVGARIPNSLTGNAGIGYGMIAVRLKDDCIHTYWEPNDSPGDPEPNQHDGLDKRGEFNIYKIYHTKKYKNGVLEEDTFNDGVYQTVQCIPSISVDEEPKEYHLEYWSTMNQTGAPSSSTQVLAMHGPQTGTGAKMIRLEKGVEKSVYLVLVKEENRDEEEDYNYLMTQSMITRTIWENYPDYIDGQEVLMDYDFTWESPAHPTQCGGHTCPHTTYCDGSCNKNNDGTNGDCGGHPCNHSGNCTTRTWVERHIQFSLYNANKNNYPNILATKDGWNDELLIGDEDKGKRWEPEDSWGYDERQSFDAETYETSSTEDDWDYVCVLMRGDDKLTIAEWVNNGEAAVPGTGAIDDLQDASSEGFKVANTPQGHRKTDTYYPKFTFNFIQDPSGDYTTQIKYSTRWVCGHSGCGTVYGICYDTQTYTLSTTLTANTVIRVETYSGNPNGGFENLDCNDSEKITGLPGMPGFASSNHNTVSGRMIRAEAVSYYPYILMKYQTRGSGYAGWHDTLTNKTAGWKKAYVLGQYSRSMKCNDYAEISWNKTGNENMDLTSTQWSVHALATDAWGQNNVLPGGATLGLRIKSGNRQHVFVTTYYTMTTGLGRLQCENTGGNSTLMDVGDAHGYHAEFAESVRDGLDNTNVQQWQNKDPNKDKAWNGGQAVNRKDSNSRPDTWNISGLIVSGQKTSDEWKYYFGDVDVGSNKGDYDAHIINTRWKAYTVFSTVNGEIKYIDTTGNPGVFSSTGGTPATDALAQALDARTGVVTKLRDAVEQATEGDDHREGYSHSMYCSDDKALNGEKWYNEAFDGITVIVEESEIEVGFVDPAERTEVLDPKLTKIQDSKGGEFGMNEDNSSTRRNDYYELGQFKTRDYSENYGMDNVETVGDFSNYVSGAQVKQDKLEYLFWTRKFWIPNFTVQDIY